MAGKETRAAGQRAGRLHLFVGLTGLALLLGYLFTNAIRRVHGDTGDFGHFYYAARAMLDGQDLYTSWHNGYIYPPLLAFLYTPFARLPEDTAATLLLACNLGLLLFAAFVAARELAERFDVAADAPTLCTIVLAGVLLTADKLRGELQMWQTNLLVLSLFVLALRWLDRRPTLAGAALGMAFNIKYLPVVVLPYLLLRRRWRAAGAFLAAIPVFAFLPAVRTGWQANLRQLGIAYAGLFRLFGFAVDSDAANIQDLRDILSMSLPSGFARILGPDVPNVASFALAGGVALAVAALLTRLYQRHGVALWYRPDGLAPEQPLARALTALEWAGLITAVLAFSPQTNTRHLSLLLFVNLTAALLLLHPRSPASRWPLLVGVGVLLLGLILPPGTPAFQEALLAWRTVSGMAWCALVMLGTLLAVGLRDAVALAEETRSLPIAGRGRGRLSWSKPPEEAA
jgi:hypothetical protein